MWITLGLLFLTSGIIYLSREIKFIKMQNDLLIISFARLLYACSCGFFAAAVCFLYGFNGVEIKLGNLVILTYDNETLISFYLFWLCSVIGYIALSSGYKLCGNRKIRFTFGNGRNARKIRRRELTDHQTLLLGVVCFVIGLAGLLIWTQDIGGVSNYIRLASALRGDYTNVYKNTKMAYRQIAKFLLPTTYIFFFLSLKNENKFFYKTLFIVSLVFSVLYLLCNDGRLTTVLFFMVLFVGYFRYGKRRKSDIKKQLVKFSLVLVIAFITLAWLDDITYFIRHQELPVSDMSSDDNIIMTLMNEFSYIYKSGTTAVKNCFPNGKLMIWDDIAFGLSAYLPGGSMLGDYVQVSRFNTMLCTGNIHTLAGSIPCDLIALSLYDLSFVGVIVIPFLMGLCIWYIENNFTGRKDNPFQQTLYFGAVLIFIRQITYCEVYDLLTIAFPYIVIWVFSKAIGLCRTKR